MNGNVFRTITIMGKSEGLDKLTADINKLASAEKNVAVVSEQTAKSSLTLEQSMAKLERRFVEGVRAQQDYEKIQKEINRAVAQNPALQARADAVLAGVNARYNQGTVAQKAFATATSGVSAQLVAMSAGAGPVGVFLSALGPWGMAAAVGIGAASSAFNYLIDGANRLGDKSIEVRKFAEVTGLTVSQIKALKSEGGKLGIGSDEITGGIEKFTVGLAEARKGTGALFEQVRAINPVLAEQLAATTNAAQGWDVLAQAMKATTDQSQKAALSRASFGRGGIELGLLAGKTADAGGIVAMGDAISRNTGLTDEWVKKTAQLRAENAQLEKQIQTMKESIYAQPVLARINEALKLEKQITEELLRRKSIMGRGGQGVGDDDAAAAREAAAARLGGRRGREAGAIAAAVDPAVIAGWQQLDDAIAAAAVSGQKVTKSLTELQNESEKAVNKERERIGLLGSAATEQERLNLRTLELNAAILQGKINQEDFNRALAAAVPESERLLKSLQQEGEIIRATTEEEKSRIKARQEYDRLVKQVGPEKAGQVAAQMLANDRSAQLAKEEAASAGKMSEYNESAARATQQRAQDSAQAANNVEREAIAAQKIYDAAAKIHKFLPMNLLDSMGMLGDSSLWDSKQGGKSQFNPAGYNFAPELWRRVAAIEAADTTRPDRMYGSGNYTTGLGLQGETTFTPDPVKVAAKMMEDAAQITKDAATKLKESADKLNDASKAIEDASKKALDETAARINAATPGAGATVKNGAIVLDPGYVAKITVDAGLRSVGTEATLQNILGGSLGKFSDQIPQQFIESLLNVLPQDKRAGVYQQELEMLRQQPITLERETLIQQLTESLNNLKESVDNMSDVFSPFYSSDPRTSKLGYRTFAGGGIMTAHGELPLRQYAGGGVATSPQVSVFGEGSTPEAYVPVPSGRIPVEVRTPANSNTRPVNVTINVMGDANEKVVAGLKQTSYQMAQLTRRALAR